MKSSLELLMMHQSCEMTGTEKFAASAIYHTSVFSFCLVLHSIRMRNSTRPSSCSSLLSSSYMSFDSFPRLDPPPPSGKKRVPRALKTTQDMMISSDPVVSSPDHAEPSPVASPDKTLPDTKEELKVNEEELQDAEETEAQESTQDQTEENGRKKVEDEKVDGTAGGAEADVEDGGSEGGEEKYQLQLQLSVPDLINKDPPQAESRDKSNEVWVKVSDSRLASTPCSGKTACRISLGEEVLLGNGAPCSKGNTVSPEEFEPHPDLLSFE